MKPIWINPAPFVNKSRRAEQGSVRTVLLVFISFFLGVAVTAFWFHHPAGGNETNVVSQAAVPQPSVESPDIPPEPRPLPPAPPPSANPQPMDPAIVEEVKKLVPNFASISLADGENILRAAALKDFAAAAADMDAQIKTAQQQLQDAQNGQSAGDQQAAMKHVQDTQSTATEKLKDIAARLQAQIAALQSLKNQP
jgi:hypothetical protein